MRYWMVRIFVGTNTLFFGLLSKFAVFSSIVEQTRVEHRLVPNYGLILEIHPYTLLSTVFTAIHNSYKKNMTMYKLILLQM
jgi:hypothetical protein